MNNKIKNAFDVIHAEIELKENTIDFINKKRHRRSLFFRLMPLYTSFLIVCALFFAGWFLYKTPVTVLSVDVNPSFELGINRFDKVVEIECFNEKGKEVTKEIDIKYLDYKDAINKIQEYFLEEEYLTITVAGKEEKHKNNILENIKKISKNEKNFECNSATNEEIKEAHKKGISFGKYKVYLELLEAGIDISEEEIKNMTMKEIRQKQKSNIDTNNKNDTKNPQGNHSNGNGNGNGNQPFEKETSKGNGKQNKK